MTPSDFRKAISTQLIATNVPGAYAYPPVPADVNLEQASEDVLREHGLLWALPNKGDTLHDVAARKRLLISNYLSTKRIIPHLVVQHGKTHVLKEKPHKVGNTSYTGTQWAGPVLMATAPVSWKDASGTWNIPAVGQPAEAQGNQGGWDSSSWVGIDGVNSNDVLQAGLQQTVDGHGNPGYVAWYEWYAPPQANSPAYVWQTNISNFTVNPGDSVSCFCQYVTNAQNVRSGYVSFVNHTTGSNFSITLTPPANATFSGNCIEWIMEAPNGGYPTVALPAFTPVRFTSATGHDTNGNAGDPVHADTWNIVYNGNTLTLVETRANVGTIYRLPITEDAIPVHYASIAAQQSGSDWIVHDDISRMLDFGSNQGAANTAVHVIQNYHFDNQRFVGRPLSNGEGMMYWTSGGAFPGAALAGEDAIFFDARNLDARNQGSWWMVTDGSSSMLSMRTVTDAVYAIGVLKKYGANYQCFVGRPHAPMIYYRR